MGTSDRCEVLESGQRHPFAAGCRCFVSPSNSALVALPSGKHATYPFATAQTAMLQITEK